ncbi:MAG TPA: phosphodiester glycosidase family protein [Kofleriaceae bacterium]
MRFALLLAPALVAACGNSEPPNHSAAKPIAATPALDASTSTALVPCPVEKPSLGAGLTVERWPLNATPAGPAVGGPAPCIDVVRADSTRFTLRLLSQKDEGAPRDAPAWLSAFHLSAVINAGMFHDNGSPVGLIVADGVERSARNTKMSGYLAWDPVDANDPPVALAGADCGSFDLPALRAHYHSIVQSYRLLGCDGAAISWLDPKQYSAAAIGLDRTGRVVLLHARAAVTMAELSRAVATHDLTGALFLEGGPEASLVAKGSEGELSRVGSYETKFVENDENHVFWTLPNVIGLLPR